MGLSTNCLTLKMVGLLLSNDPGWLVWRNIVDNPVSITGSLVAKSTMPVPQHTNDVKHRTGAVVKHPCQLQINISRYRQSTGCCGKYSLAHQNRLTKLRNTFTTSTSNTCGNTHCTCSTISWQHRSLNNQKQLFDVQMGMCHESATPKTHGFHS